MANEQAYNTLKRLLESGNIEDLNEIVNIIGKTKIKGVMGMHYDTFRKRIHNPENFSLKHIKKLADLIGVDPKVISNLILDKMEKKGKKNK